MNLKSEAEEGSRQKSPNSNSLRKGRDRREEMGRRRRGKGVGRTWCSAGSNPAERTISRRARRKPMDLAIRRVIDDI